jgi:hypothetical protein
MEAAEALKNLKAGDTPDVLAQIVDDQDEKKDDDIPVASALKFKNGDYVHYAFKDQQPPLLARVIEDCYGKDEVNIRLIVSQKEVSVGQEWIMVMNASTQHRAKEIEAEWQNPPPTQRSLHSSTKSHTAAAVAAAACSFGTKESSNNSSCNCPFSR